MLRRLFSFLLLALVAAVVIAACRPSIAEDNQSPGATAEPTDSPPPAAALKPDVQMNVEIHLFRGFGTADSALLYAQALDSFRDVNLVADLIPPIAGYDPFAVEPADNTVQVWVGTVGDVAPSVAAGLELVAVGELEGNDPTVLAGPAKAYPKNDAALAQKAVLVDTGGAADSLRAALVAAQVDPGRVKIQTPDDPAAPFDPTPLLDSTAAAAAVSIYDGWARIQEGQVAAGGQPDAFVEKPIRTSAEGLLGELIWVQKSDLTTALSRSAVAALLGVIAQTQVACANAVEDCASAASAQSDRSPEGIAWSIDQLDRTIFPAPDGIVHIDPGAWQRTIAAMQAAGVAAADKLPFTNEVVDDVFRSIGKSLDLTGASWKPRDDLKLIP